MSDIFEFSAQDQMSLRERAVSDIRMAILTGKLKPNDRLIETTIANQMRISRGTLREALRQLEQEGLVVSESYRETRVANIDEEAIREVLFPARRVLEVFMVEKAVGKLNEKNFEYLDNIVKTMRKGAERDDLATVVEKDVEFHQYLLNISGYKNLIPLWQGMTCQIRVHFYKVGLSKDLHSIVDEHEELLKVLRTGDLECIVAASSAHIHL